jgi:glycosyltransferase involved in cell wall biosynthesis
LEQEFRDFELLVIDDGSSDGSQAVMDKYAALDGRIATQRNPTNLGAVRNWNRCLAQAKGDYVKLLCCDDALVTPQALGKMVSLLDANPTAVLAASGRNITDDHSRVLEVCSPLGAAGLKNGRAMVAHCLENNGNLIGEPSSVMFRRENAARGFDERYRQLVDLEMWFHLLEQGDLVYIPEALCTFRKHPHQMSAVNQANQLAVDEPDMLLVDYFPKAWLKAQLSREALFIQIYGTRKRRSRPETVHAIGREMLNMLGRHWYAALWLRHKAAAPASHLRRFLAGHLRP